MGVKKVTAFGGSNRNEVTEVPTFNRSASADRDGQSRASRPPKGDFRGVISEVLTEHEKSSSYELLFSVLETGIEPVRTLLSTGF